MVEFSHTKCTYYIIHFNLKQNFCCEPRLAIFKVQHKSKLLCRFGPITAKLGNNIPKILKPNHMVTLLTPMPEGKCIYWPYVFAYWYISVYVKTDN